MPSDYQNDALRSLSHDKTGGAESGGDELRKLWPTVPSDERKDVSGIEEAVALVQAALNGVPDSTTLYARGMKLTGWRHEVTAGEVRALIARVDAVTAERDRYKAALAKYGAHDSDCTFRFGMNPELFPCTCGLDAAKESR